MASFLLGNSQNVRTQKRERFHLPNLESVLLLLLLLFMLVVRILVREMLLLVSTSPMNLLRSG